MKYTGLVDRTSLQSFLLCDKMVTLWRLAALNPSNSRDFKTSLKIKFKDWQKKIMCTVCNILFIHCYIYCTDKQNLHNKYCR